MLIIYGLGATLASALLPLVIKRISMMVEGRRLERKDWTSLLDVCFLHYCASLGKHAALIPQSCPNAVLDLAVDYQIDPLLRLRSRRGPLVDYCSS